MDTRIGCTYGYEAIVTPATPSGNTAMIKRAIQRQIKETISTVAIITFS